MHIAVNASIVYANPTGMGIYVINVLRHLATLARGTDRITVFSGYPSALEHLDVDLVRLPRVVQPRFGRLGGMFRFLWTQAYLAGAAKRAHCDLLFNATHHGVPYQIKGIPQVVTIQTDVDVAFEFPRQHRLQHYYFRYFVPRLVGASAAIITTSQYAKRALVRRYGMQETQVYWAYNGYDRSTFTPNVQADDTAVRERHCLDDHMYVLAVNATFPHKNVETLLSAFQALHAHHPALRLCIAGYRRAYLVPLLARLGDSMRRAIVAVPYVNPPELSSLYRGALCLVAPSLHESFGMPCVEAMACGCPVIASTASALPEICADAAHFVSPRDASGFAEAIRRGLTDRAFLQVLQLKGAQRASSFDWRNTAERIYVTLQEVYHATQHQRQPKPVRQASSR